MSSDSCIILHQHSSDTGYAMKGETENEVSSDEVQNVTQNQDTGNKESGDTPHNNKSETEKETNSRGLGESPVVVSNTNSVHTSQSLPRQDKNNVAEPSNSAELKRAETSTPNNGGLLSMKGPGLRHGNKGIRRNNLTEENLQEMESNCDADATSQSTSGEGKLRRSGPQHEEATTRIEDADEANDATTRDVDFEITLLSQRNKRVLMSRLVEVAPRGKLSMINLCRRGVGVEEALLLKEAIRRNPQLYVLKLSYNNLGDEGAAIIASALLIESNRHHQLSVLDLGFNNIGDAGCGSLAVHCVAGNHNLQTLYLAGNQIGEKGSLAIAGAILHGTSLQSLYLSANQIGPMGMKTIAGAIAKNEARISTEQNDMHARHMEVLHLASASIESSGFMAIPGMLLSNSSLRSLCISDNNLDDQDILLLSQALTQNKLVPMESLQLSFNQITCQGVECLMNALWGSPTLRELKLDNNKIQDRGAQLCAVVLTSISLENLDLSFNRVTTAGIKALMKNLSENNTLQNLGLSGIPIDQNASKAVSYALAYNTSLRALHLDNCSTGYASQRHIVAGAVSNRKSSLRVLTGFLLSPIAMTLGMPRLPEDWSNDQVLGFFRLMWEQWLLKSRQGSTRNDDDAIRGPAPPAAVAAAAKIAFASLGTIPPDKLFQTELHEKPLTERAPVEPASAAILERSDSGTVRIPLFSVSSEVGLNDFVDGESKAAVIANNSPSPQLATVRSPMENPERRNRNLQWLRLHFRALTDVGRLPFNNADLWQLHQYYFSPPLYQTDEEESSTPDSETHRSLSEPGTQGFLSIPQQTPSLATTTPPPSMDRAISFQALGQALEASGALSQAPNSHKRRSNDIPGDEEGRPATKRAKNLKPRIAYYPRIMAKIQSLGTRPMSDTLSLLRQLKYAESVMFTGKNPYAEPKDATSDDATHSDIDMILLDLL